MCVWAHKKLNCHTENTKNEENTKNQETHIIIHKLICNTTHVRHHLVRGDRHGCSTVCLKDGTHCTLNVCLLYTTLLHLEAQYCKDIRPERQLDKQGKRTSKLITYFDNRATNSETLNGGGDKSCDSNRKGISLPLRCPPEAYIAM